MSYPYLSDLIKALTGIDLPLPIAMFGLMVACALLAGASLLTAELRRLHGSGQLGLARRRDGVTALPHEVVPNLTMVVMFAGVIGARVFHILEHTDSFVAAPWAMILSRSGLSVFGGLIFGTIAGLLFVRRWGLPLRPLLDAAAPAMMLGYAIGRVGCQISGDGDWGIAADMAGQPDWLPTWFWAQTYTGNIYGEVIAAPGVYPTPVYETAMALACFGLLWALRKHPFKTGWLFSVYLLMAGLERLLIEQIRVNPVLDLGLLRASQAELIGAGMAMCGLAGIALLGRRKQKHPGSADLHPAAGV